jgi:hypothetical protein
MDQKRNNVYSIALYSTYSNLHWGVVIIQRAKKVVRLQWKKIKIG